MPPRPLRPKNEPAVPESSDAASDSKSGKRRAVSSACIPCRKRKSKCDGQLPSCSTCVAVYRTECSYDENSDHRRKGPAKRDVPSLQQQNDALDVIVASLRSLPESEAISLLNSLRGDTNPDALADALRSHVRPPPHSTSRTLEADFVQQITATPSNITAAAAAAAAAASSSFEASPYRPPLPPLLSNDAASSSSSQAATSSNITPIAEQSTVWFRVPQDAELVEHLLSLYFCWVNPFYGFLSREHFAHDMGHARADFCSPLLVNTVLSFACHYSDRAQARTDPGDASTAGNHFFAEAKHLLNQSDKPCLTTVQALGIMSLRETSAGRDSNGYQLAGRCVRMAVELGLHLSAIKNVLRPPEAEVRKIVFWAVFNLETMCAVSFGRLSQLPRSAADIETPSTNLRSEAQTWRPYEDVHLSVSPNTGQPARSMLFTEQLSKLSELASDMVNTFYAPRERFTSRRLAATYAQYQEWYRNLPDVFRLPNTTLPHVLILHMYYFGCVLHLFRPYIKLDLRGANLYPRNTCTACADEISALMGVLRASYGLRRVCLVVTNLLLSASTIHLLNLPSETAASHLSQGLQDLEAMSVNHRFAARAVDIVRSLSAKWNISLPEDAAAAASRYRLGQQRDIASPPPSTFFAASIPRKESSESGGRSNESGSSHQDSPFGPPSQQHPYQQTAAPTFYGDPTTPSDPSQITNPFWTPFPAQGMPNLQASNLMDLPQYDSQHAWPVYTDSAGGAAEYHSRQQSAPGRIDESMGGMGEWTWQ